MNHPASAAWAPTSTHRTRYTYVCEGVATRDCQLLLWYCTCFVVLEFGGGAIPAPPLQGAEEAACFETHGCEEPRLILLCRLGSCIVQVAPLLLLWMGAGYQISAFTAASCAPVSSTAISIRKLIHQPSRPGGRNRRRRNTYTGWVEIAPVSSSGSLHGESCCRLRHSLFAWWPKTSCCPSCPWRRYSPHRGERGREARGRQMSSKSTAATTKGPHTHCAAGGLIHHRAMNFRLSVKIERPASENCF